MNKLLFAILLVALTSCSPNPVPSTPPLDQIEDVLNTVLADTGFFSDASISRVVGKHYLPGEDRWQIVACFMYTDAAENETHECNDSFMLFQLDNERWIVSVNRNGVYRWREVVNPSLDPATDN